MAAARDKGTQVANKSKIGFTLAGDEADGKAIVENCQRSLLSLQKEKHDNRILYCLAPFNRDFRRCTLIE